MLEACEQQEDGCKRMKLHLTYLNIISVISESEAKRLKEEAEWEEPEDIDGGDWGVCTYCFNIRGTCVQCEY